MSDLTLAFLGPLLVTQNGSPITSFRSHKERALLAYLADEADKPHQRSSLISLFWPEMPEEVARNNLSQTLGRLRRTLASDEPPPDRGDAETFNATREQIQFVTGKHIHIDTRRFCASLDDFRLATKGQTKEISTIEAALQLYRGEFLAGLSLPGCEEFEQWLLFKRAYYQRLAVEGLDHLAGLYLDGGRYVDAQGIAHRHLALEPWAESAHRQLMRALALNGQRASALTQYERCRNVLLAELEVEPEAETTALFQQIQRGELRESELYNRATVQEMILPATSVPPSLSHDWHEMPTLPNFFGRSAELAQLQQWLVADRCALVAILGIGGQGKTALSAQLVPTIAAHFELVIWRSLLNAPPLEELLVTILPSLSGEPGNLPPTTLDQQLALCFTYLQQRRVLLVLDNLESILQADVAGHYRAGYEPYDQLLYGIATRQHQGQLLLTSRERPQGVARWAEERPLVRVLALDGLDAASGQSILASRGLAASERGVRALVAHYSGNPLALKLIAQTVKDLFGGDVAAFLATEMPIFEDIRAVLEQQFARLSPLEQEILVWLAIEREPIVVPTLRENLVQPGSQRALIEAVRALQRRSLVEQHADGFLLQNVVMEFTTDILVEQLYRELETSAQDATPVIARMAFNRYALLKATAKEYVRTSQMRLIVEPLIARLVTDLGKSATVARLNALLADLRSQATPVAGYAAGNLLNLLLHLGVDLRGYDFSRLPVRQAHLQGHWLPQVNFRAADLTHSVFTHVFGLILAIRYDAAGQLWLAGVRADRLGLWRAAAGQFLEDYHEYGTGSTVCVFSADLANGEAGTLLLASGSVDRKVRLWNVRELNVRGTMERGRLLHTIDHFSTPWSLAFSPDGKLLAGGTGDGAIAIWDVQSGRLLQNHLLRAHNAAITALAFSLDGQQLASGDVDGVIYLWQIHAPEPRYALTGHEKEVHVLLFDSTGERLISGSYDHSIRVWDLQQHAGSDRLLQTLREHTRFIRTLVLSPDGRTLASGGYDTFICLWDIGIPKSGQGGEPGTVAQLRQRLRQAGPAHWLAFDPTTSGFAQRLAIVGIDLTVSIWDTQRGQPVETLQVYKDHLATMAISPDGRWLAGGSMDGIIRLWDRMDEENRVQHLRPETVGSANRNTRWIRTLAFCPARFTNDGAARVILASGGSDQTIRLWDLSTGRQLAALLGHGDDVDCIHFSPRTGKRLVSSSRDQTVRLWDVHVAPDSATVSARLLDTFYGHTNHVVTCAFSPDERLVASGSLDRTVRLWAVGDAGTGQLLHTLVGHKSGVRCVLFSPDGRRLVSSSYDQSVIVWDVAEGCVLDMFVEETTVLSLAFHPDGNLLALGLNDFTICLYDVQHRKTVTRLSGHSSTVESVHFSPDGQWLASASEDGVIKRWEVVAALAGRDACLQTLQVDRPYAGMQIAGAIGITAAQRAALQALGAVEDDKVTR